MNAEQPTIRARGPKLVIAVAALLLLFLASVLSSTRSWVSFGACDRGHAVFKEIARDGDGIFLNDTEDSSNEPTAIDKNEEDEQGRGVMLTMSRRSDFLRVMGPPAEEERENVTFTSSGSNKTLVILWGTIRGAEPIWRSFYERLLDLNPNTDLALMIGKPLDGGGARRRPRSSLWGRAEYVWEFPEYEDWGSVMDLLYGTSPDDLKNKTYSWRDFAKDTNKGPFGGTKEDNTSSGAIRGLIHMWIGQTLEKLGLMRVYDRFIVTRTDQYYTADLDLATLSPNYIWVPEGEDWGGICDRFYVCPSHLILKALCTHPKAIRHPKKYSDFNDRSELGNVEGFIKMRWQGDGLMKQVRRFKRPMYTAAVKEDEARWVKATLEAFVENNVQVLYKYPGEYDGAMNTARWVEQQQKSGKDYSLAL